MILGKSFWPNQERHLKILKMMAVQKMARRRAVRYNYSFIFTLNEIYMFLFSIIKFKKQAEKFISNVFFGGDNYAASSTMPF